MANTFRVLGLRVLPNCDFRIRKVLKKDELYLFFNDYKENKDDKHVLTKVKGKRTSLDEHLYNVKGANGDVSVNISAIVAKNGHGKSTIVEILIRLINNFAFVMGYKENQPSLDYANGVHAIAYFELNDHQYTISCENEYATWYRDGIALNEFGPNMPANWRKYTAKQMEDELFYSIIVNYSLYAYNSNKYEWESAPHVWIDALFYKNDAYQTPIVLNPMRKEGNIDVNNEDYLSRQRLMSIFTFAKTKEERFIKEGTYAHGFAFRLEQKSKLLEHTIGNYVMNSQNTGRKWDALEKLSSDSEHSENQELREQFFRFWDSFTSFFHRNPKLFNLLYNYNLEGEMEPPKETDFSLYVNMVESKCKVHQLDEWTEEHDIIKNTFTSKGLNWLNITQLFRLFVVQYVWEYLFGNGYSLDDAIASYESHDVRNPRQSARMYAVYKIISILEKYKPYRDHPSTHFSSFDIMLNPIEKYLDDSDLKSQIDKALNDKDFTTLKLRQTLQYIKSDVDEYYGAETISERNLILTHLLSFDKLRESFPEAVRTNAIQPDKQLEFLPPPIFEGDIVITDGKDTFELQSMSSGEIQRLYTVSTITYHLRNLEYQTGQNEMVKYSNIFIVLEEIELYFHPEYQKTFIAYLLDHIERLSLNDIKRIHLLFVTHSPFILSDIQGNNMLCLTKEKQGSISSKKTFGANLYDLLADQFFMDGFIGDFAKRKVLSLMNYLENPSLEDNKWNKKDALDFIKHKIGEPLLRQQLMELYENAFCDDQIEILERRLEALKQQKKQNRR